MHLLVKVDGEGLFRWTMVASRENMLPLAVGVSGYGDPITCEHAAKQLLTARAAAMMALQQSDGAWRWVVAGPDGQRLAESAVVFANAAACGYALHELREAIASEMRNGAKATSK